MTRDMWYVTCDTWYVTRDMWHVTRDMWHVTCDTWYVTCDTWHVTRDMWHVTCDTWHVKRDMWHMTRDTFGGVNILSKCQLPSSYCLLFIMKIWRKRLTDLMSDEAVYRTAPDTPGLLKKFTIVSSPAQPCAALPGSARPYPPCLLYMCVIY